MIHRLTNVLGLNCILDSIKTAHHTFVITFTLLQAWRVIIPCLTDCGLTERLNAPFLSGYKDFLIITVHIL